VTVLPAGDVLRIDPRKLVNLLTSDKARFFTSLGFSRLRSSELDPALRVHPVRNQIEDIFLTVHGVKFTVRCSLPSPDGRDPCALTVWIVDPGETQAQFVTAYASPPA
jgi:filamentous hemagglutinin